MGLRINTNVEAIDAQRNLQLTSMDFQKAIQRLSSGLRINSAADDPAGLALSQTLTSQVNGYDQAQRNIQDGISMTQVADSALNSTASALQRMRTLAVQAANDSLTNQDRTNIQAEVKTLAQEIDRIANQTEFNSKKLLDGSAGGAAAVGGGPDIQSVTAEGQVAIAGTYFLTSGAKSQSATKSSFESGAFNSPGTFTQASNITITGGGGTQTFTATAGENVQDFFKAVNTSTVGVTIGVDSTTGLVQITNNTFGIQGKDANNNTNATGSQAVAVANLSGDFALGQAIDFTGVGGAKSGSIVNGNFVAGTAAINSNVEVTNPNGTNNFITGQGLNSDTLSGTGMPGVTIVLSNPGNITATATANADSFTVTESNLLNIQSSPNNGEAFKLGIASTSALSLGVANLDLSTQANAETAITTVTNAINTLSVQRSVIGAQTNGLTDALTNASLSEQNLQQARSNILDANIATETINFTRDQILLQSGTSVLAQANQAPTNLLALLR